MFRIEHKLLKEGLSVLCEVDISDVGERRS